MYSRHIGPLCNDHLDGTWEHNVLERRSATLLGIVFDTLTVSILMDIEKERKLSEKIRRVVTKNEYLYDEQKRRHIATKIII